MSKALKKIDWTRPIVWLVEDAARLAIVGRNPNNPDLMVIAAGDRAICVDDYGRESDLIGLNVPPIIRNVPETKLRPLTMEEFLASGVTHCRKKSYTAVIRVIVVYDDEFVIGGWEDESPQLVTGEHLLSNYELYYFGRGWGPAGIEVTE